MKRGYLVDSDVFIDFLRGQPEAVEFIKRHFPDLALSVISVAEIYAGIREGDERDRLEKALAACHQIEVSVEIARKAGMFKRTFGKSHAVKLPDALIAASAVENGLVLCTLNKRHFPMIGDAFVPYRKSPGP